jgi:hypothetical protein
MFEKELFEKSNEVKLPDILRAALLTPIMSDENISSK